MNKAGIFPKYKKGSCLHLRLTEKQERALNLNDIIGTNKYCISIDININVNYPGQKKGLNDKFLFENAAATVL